MVATVDPGLMRVGRKSGGYVIDGSAQFKASSSQYYSRVATAGDTKNGTVALVFQLTKLASQVGASVMLYCAGTDASNYTSINLDSSDRLEVAHVEGGSPLTQIVTNRVFRDAVGFMSLEVSWALDEAVAADRWTIKVNGVAVTSFATNTREAAGNTVFFGTNGATYAVGRRGAYSANYFDGHITRLIYIDGPGTIDHEETDANGYPAQPIRPVVSAYGTNGFWFEGSSFGTDRSTNGNDFAAVNSPTIVNNSPTNDPANDVGLYAVLSAVAPSGGTISEAGLYGYTGNSVGNSFVSTLAVSEGKWYAEFYVDAWSAANYATIGIAKTSFTPNSKWVGETTDSYGYYGDGSKYNNSSGAAYGASFTTGDYIGVELDLDAGTLQFYKNGVAQGNAYTGLSGTFTFACGNAGVSTWSKIRANFGQTDFEYAAPTGFNPLCTAHFDVMTTSNPETGSFTGNAAADGPVVWLGGPPDIAGTCTINGNAITWGTHAIPLATGFKIITSSSSYNAAGSNTYSIATDTLGLRGPGTAQARAA